MNNYDIKNVLYIVMAIFFGIIIVRFIIWLLPIVLIGLFSYYIYRSIKKNRKVPQSKTTKKKKIKIIDMVEEDK